MIRVENITKSYATEQVLADLSLQLDAQHTLSILGKSGSGKSTLLKIMAGIESADKGNIFVNNLEVTQLPPQQRDMVYLSQEPLLFPHLSVFENIAFGLRIRKQRNIEEQVKIMADRLGITNQLHKQPSQLSGGQQQRVNFGRALIINPSVILLDEPFGSLDTQTRSEMQKLFNELKTAYSITAIFVTHDLKEALLMGDKIATIANKRLNIYNTKHDFINDEQSGALAEIRFWETLKKGNL